MKAFARNVRISPKKLNVVAATVRGLDARKALDILRFMPKKGSDFLYKVIASAVANATHNDMQAPETLVVNRLVVSKGVDMKRGQPISRGRSHPILKRSSNISVELSSL